MFPLKAVVCFSFCLLCCFAENPKSTGFFCDEWVGSDVQQWKDPTRDDQQLCLAIKVKSGELVDLDHASKVCKQCHDADVISHADALNLPRTLLPVWINLTVWLSTLSNGTKNITWINPTNLKNFTPKEIVWVHSEPTSMNCTYALLAMPPSDGSTDVWWAAMPQHELYFNAATRRISMDIFVVRTVICRRPVRKTCHYWTTESERCVFDPKFGCHTYETGMSQPPDDVADNETICSEVERTVKRCPLSNCTCSVTPWNEWSLCDEKYCTTQPNNRTRRRRVVEPCHVGWVHEILDQTEPCPLPKNCEILANNFTMNDSLILKRSE